MKETTIREDPATIVLEEKASAIATVGYFCIAATLWMTGMLMAGWYMPAAIPGITMGTIYAIGSILLLVIGILSVIYWKRMLDSIIFLSMAGLFFSLYAIGITNFTLAAFPAYFGWYGIVWAVFFCYLWIGSFGSGTGAERLIFLLLFWLAGLGVALSGWLTSAGLEFVSGYLILGASVLAFITSATEVLAHKFGRVWSTREDFSASAQAHPGLA